MILTSFKHIFAKVLAPHVQLDENTVYDMIEMPPNPEMGDLAFPCFTLAKTLKKAPQVLASEIAEQLGGINSVYFTSIQAVGPYINAFVSAQMYITAVFTKKNLINRLEVAQKEYDEVKKDVAQIREDVNKLHDIFHQKHLLNHHKNSKSKILLEYMSGNPNKPLHVGHARNVCIGDTLRRVFMSTGYAIETSHYGDDSGVNVGYNIVGHLYYGLPLETDKKFDHYCGDIYLQMRGKDEDPEFKEKLSKTLHAIENNSDPEIMKLHKNYVKKCTIEQLRSCRRVGAVFSMINWETDILHLDLFAEALDILKKRGHVVFAEEGDAKGCWIIDLSSLPLYQKEEKQYAILVKSDGVATYVAKDIAFAMWKLGYLNKKFHFYSFVDQPDVDGTGSHTIYSTTSDASIAENKVFGDYSKAITIIDNRQIPAQTVVRSSLELLGLLGEQADGTQKEYTPLGYGVVYLTPNTLMKGGFSLTDEEKGMVRLPFASRKGWTVTMDSMLDLLQGRAYEETKKRNTALTEDQLKETAESIAVSSFRFFLTKTDILKDITFDIDEVLDMEGETGAYVLYTNARIKAVIEKASQDMSKDIDEHEKIGSLLSHPLEMQLIKKIDEMSSVMHEVADNLAPHLLNRYLISASQLFNSYYNEVNISKSEGDSKYARIALLKTYSQSLENAMKMLGMKPVDRM